MFEQQFLNARDHVVPFVASHVKLSGARVLDVGTGDGGLMKAFIEAGAKGTGVDSSAPRIEFARSALEQECDAGILRFEVGDIHDPSVSVGWDSAFDLVVLKDAIEHIAEKDILMERLKSFLRPRGAIFLGFPPWRMPYGGHQQITHARMARLPYYHLLPGPLYPGVLRMLGESDKTVADLLEIRDTRVSIDEFERLVAECNLKVVKREFFLINPIYRYKFGLRPRRQFGLIGRIPVLRDFVTTTCYYLVQPANTPVHERIVQD